MQQLQNITRLNSVLRKQLLHIGIAQCDTLPSLLCTLAISIDFRAERECRHRIRKLASRKGDVTVLCHTCLDSMVLQYRRSVSSSIMQLSAVRGVAYRSICICACAYILTAATMLGVHEGTDQELQALRILRSIYEYLSSDADSVIEVHVLKYI